MQFLANQIALQCEFDKNQILKSQIPKPNHYHFGFYASEINAQFSCQITKCTYCKTLKKVDILFLQTETMQYSCNTVLGELGATMNLSLNSLQNRTNTMAVNVFSSAYFFHSHFFSSVCYYCKTLKKVDILFLQMMQYSCETIFGELGAA